MKPMIVFIDSGDTIVNEDTEILDPEGNVVKADLIPGAEALLMDIKAQGWLLALVADGRVVSFDNVYHQHDLRKLFDGWSVSEAVGAPKPDKRMFYTAMAQLHLTDEDIPRIVMIGNNIERDIRGANALGITSILMRWSKNYSYDPQFSTDIPKYSVSSHKALRKLLNELSQEICDAENA